MKCPYCNYDESKVVDTRPTEEGGKIRRRRECLKCASRFTTYEIIETRPIMVEKKDSTFVIFNKQKIVVGIVRACEKRPITVETIDNIVKNIESTIQNEFNRHVTTVQIGTLVMDHLKKLDEVAYIRFASVYKQYSDANSFINEIKEMMDTKN